MQTFKRRTLVKSLIAGPLAMREAGLAAAPATRPDFVDVRATIGGDGDISAALRQALSSGESAWIAPGRYRISGRIDQGDLTIEAAPDATIEAIGDDNVIFCSSGSFSRLPQPIGRVGKGKTRLRLARAHGLHPGDWIVVFDPANFSWHASRPYYRAGEWCEVAAVTSRAVTLAKPLRANYLNSEIQLFHVSLRRPKLIGGIWKCGGRELARYTACTGRLVDVERVDAACNTAIYIDRCVDAEVRCRSGHNTGAGLDDYLICIGNSQSVRIKGERLFSRRHPVAIGGGDLVCGVPCRDCIVEGITLENDLASNVMCADIHGNAEDCGYVGCIIFGGISLGGANPSYLACKVYARRDGTAAEATELVGGAINLTGIQITSDATNVGGGRGIIDIGTQNGAFNASTRDDVTLSMTDFSIQAPNLARNEAIIRIRNTGSVAGLNIRVNRGKLKLNQAVQFLRTERISGRDISKIIEIENVSGLPAQSAVHYAVSGAYGGSYRKLQQPR